MNNKKILNLLVDLQAVGCVVGASGWARIFRFRDLDYVFEIGKNCGTVFSVDLVESVKIIGNQFEVTLKRQEAE